MNRRLLLLLISWTAAACTVDPLANPGRRCTENSECTTGVCYREFCITIDGGVDAGNRDATITDPDTGVADPDGGPIDGGQTCSEEGMLRDCYSGPAGTSTVAPCHGGQQECRGGFWGRCIGEVVPIQEIDCNGIDDNCNRVTDELANSAPCNTGQRGVCARGVNVCMGASIVCTATITASDEVCNNLDDDCDGDVDEDVGRDCFTGMAGCTPIAGGKFDCVGVCKAGFQVCTAGVYGACEGEKTPTKEVCDALAGNLAVDDNCDGRVDENCGCTDGQFYSCYNGPAGTSTVGTCMAGMAQCIVNELGSCTGEQVPVAETCANQEADNDCDGIEDNVTDLGSSCTNTMNQGICREGVYGCVNNARECITPLSRTELCNSLDDDCDGSVDEDFLLLSDELNCGVCGRACGVGTSCCNGTCVDITSDADHCNGCNNDCGVGRECCSSQCRDLQIDNGNCSACGNACPTNTTCCGGACVDTRSSANACGSCTRQCGGTTPVCCASMCHAPGDGACDDCFPDCTGTQTCCNTTGSPVCADRMTDPNNCGACGVVCTGGTRCCGGSCVPNDEANCGSCGNSCSAGTERCCGGTCTPINATNCAACADVCMAGDACCVTGCESTRTDPMNCGGCGISCPANTNCSNGRCCAPGLTGCEGGCRNLQNDNNNCGSCGNVCPILTGCSNGTCCLLGLGC